MDPQRQCCHNPDCSERGVAGGGTIRIHSWAAQRYQYRRCRRTFRWDSRHAVLSAVHAGRAGGAGPHGAESRVPHAGDRRRVRARRPDRRALARAGRGVPIRCQPTSRGTVEATGRTPHPAGLEVRPECWPV